MVYLFLPILISALSLYSLKASGDTGLFAENSSTSILSAASELDTNTEDTSLPSTAWHESALNWLKNTPENYVPRFMVGTDPIQEFQGSLGASIWLTPPKINAEGYGGYALTLRGTAGLSGYGCDVGLSVVSGFFFPAAIDISLSYLHTNSHCDDVIHDEDYYGIKLDVGFMLARPYVAWYTNLNEDDFFMIGFGVGL